MSRLDLEKLDYQIRRNLYNPQNMFRDALYGFRDASDNTMVPVTAATPFANLVAYISTTSAVGNDLIERAQRRQLPEYATTIQELSHHFDYNELQTIYASPSSVVVNLVFPVEELMQAAISKDGGATRQVIIPRDSVFTYTDDTTFGIFFDIMVRIIDRDTMDIYYIDNDNKMMDIGTPIINYVKTWRRDSQFNSTEMITIPIEVYQFSRKTEYRTVTQSSGFNETFKLTDQLYHIAVRTKIDGRVIELTTVHGDFKYNPGADVATAVLEYLTDNTVRVRIPDVYIDNGLVGPEIALTIYQTKGNVDINMAVDGVFNFTPEFLNTQTSIEDSVNALRNVVNLGAYADTNPSGGMDCPSLEELRMRVIIGDTSNDALTEEQLEVKLRELGYDLSHELNYIGANVFMTSSKISDYEEGSVPTTVGSATTSILMNDLRDRYGIIFPEDKKVVISPYAIIDTSHNSEEFMSTAQVEALNGLDNNGLIQRLNNDRLLTPIFYYLLDTTTETPLYGAFDLDNPVLTTPAYMQSNPESMIKIATEKINISKVDGSYFIDIITTGNDSARELQDNDITLQLTTVDEFGSVFSINAKLVTRTKEGDFFFRSELTTGFNVSMSKTIEILNFDNSIYDSYHMPLNSKFYLNYVVTSANHVGTDSMLTEYINPATLPELYTVATLETMEVTIGRLLDGLFLPIKSSYGTMEYETHKEDILRYYDEDVYEMDGQNKKFYPNGDYDPDQPTGPDNQPLIFNKLHSKGDPVMIDGKQDYVAYKGDTVTDANNQPIPVRTGDYNHLVNIQTLDYKYRLIGYAPQAQYEIKANWDRDIEPIAERMIQDTELKYSISNTIGDMEVMLDGDTRRTISNEITMGVTVKVTETTYKDGTLRNNITQLIKDTIVAHLSNGEYIENALVDEINAVIKASVISFKVDYISTLGDVQSFHVINGSDNMGIKSVLAIGDTGSFEILDGIDVKFLSQ